MPNTSSRLASLSPEERAALVMQFKRKSQRAETPVDNTIRRRKNRNEAPLSFAQQRLWFLHQLDPDSSAYHLPVYYRFSGALNIAALEQSLNEIVRRHEILRTVFGERDDTPLQIVQPSLHVALPLIDLSALSRLGVDREVERIFEVETARPFSLELGPLLRALLLKLSADEHAIFLVFHHIVTDGWSMDIFVSELLALYRSFSAGESSPLAELPLQYGDFAAWQRESLAGETLDQHLAYWKQQLSGELPVLELPTDHPRPLRVTNSGADEFFDATLNLTEKLNDLAKAEGATLFMTLLAAFLTLLHRYTGQSDILLGTAIAGRNHAQIENLIGFFINNVVLRTDLSGNPTFRELLHSVRDVALGAYEHQDVPFEKLVEELQPERDQSRQPLFQVMFNLQNAPTEAPAAEGLSISTQDIGNQTRFDLEFHLWVVPEGLAGPLIYNTDLFERATIVRLLGHFQTLLEGIAANPDARISELPLLTKEELRQAHEWSASPSKYERDACVHTLVEAEAARRPEALAVIFGEHQLAFRELNERANQLAHYLRKRGVGLEVRVGVLLEPSVEFVIALLAILKAGGSYVPLDGGYPRQRLQFMLEDAGVKLLLTTREQPEIATNEVEVIYLDDAGRHFEGESRDNPVTNTSAENLAYVMYTSGSTGQPKGVAVMHRNINRLIRNTNYAELNENDRMAQVSNVSFDAATWELWGTFTSGGTLIGLTKETMLSPVDLKRAIVEHGITVMFLTVAVVNQVAQSEPDAFAPLRYLLFGGEACDVQAVRRIIEHGKPDHLINICGPTETTTYSVWYDVEEVAPGARSIPIGKSVSNTEAWVLDQYGNVAPVGVYGEMYVAGDGIARGYLRRPELTAERFVPNPFSTRPGDRLYRSGDLVRYLSDGNIDFIQRIDHQVKLRGFRIELGEIEAALHEHPAVGESVVVVREDTPNDKRLIAYIVPHSNDPQLVTQLRSWLRERLPDYFMPSFFVVLDKLPLTPNGKVDKRALPPPEGQQSEATLLAPRTPEEEKVAEIWADVLNLKPIDVQANFFDIGGHSLLATRVVTRIREAFGVQLPLRVMFDSPTIAAVAAHIVEMRGQSEIATLAEIVEKLTHLSEDEAKSLLKETASSPQF